MTRFIALLNDSNYINIPADKMTLDDAYISVFQCGELIAVLDISIVLCAYISEKSPNQAVKQEWC